MPRQLRHRKGLDDYGEIEPTVVVYLNALACGEGVGGSARIAGTTRDTIWRWRAEFPDFAHEEQLVKDRLYIRFDSARYCRCLG